MLKSWSVAVFSATFAAVLGLQHAVAEPLSLKDALIFASQHNPDVAVAKSDYDADSQDLALARAQALPALSADATYEDTGGNEQSSNAQRQSGTITVNQPLFDVRIWAQVKQARTTAVANRQQLALTEQDVMLSAGAAYLSVLRDTSNAQLHREYVEVLSEFHASVDQRMALGELSLTDSSQAAAREIAGRIALLEAEAHLEGSKSSFSRFVGLPSDDLDESSVALTTPDSEAELLEIAYARNPAIRQSELRKAAAESGLTAARGSLLPSLSFRAQYGRLNGATVPGLDDNRFSVAANLHVPIFSGGAEFARVRQAQARLNSTAANIEASRNAVTDEVHQAWARFRGALEALQLGSLQIESNQTALQGAQLESQVGERSTLDILNAQQELLNSRVQVLNARHDANLSRLQLLAAMGSLTGPELPNLSAR